MEILIIPIIQNIQSNFAYRLIVMLFCYIGITHVNLLNNPLGYLINTFGITGIIY